MTEHKYCAYPFNEIFSDNASRYRLCCYADVNKSIEKYDTINTLPFDFFLSDEMEQIRQDMVEGKRVQGCEYCYKLEDAGKPSPRTQKYNRERQQKAEVEKVSLKLRIGGSLCNLGCYMCLPFNSSYRRQELKQSGIDKLWYGYNKDDPIEDEVYDDGPSFDVDARNISSRRFDEIVDNIIKNIDKVDHIKFFGGEPIIIPRMWEIMDRVPNEAAKNITISFQTNLTKLHYNNYSIFDIQAKFKKLWVQVSSDHYGERLKWIRYPIDVEEFERNLVDAKHLIGGIVCTTSILNVNDLFEIKNYYEDNFDLPVNFGAVVSNPSMLSCKNVKNKKELLTKYHDEEFKMVRAELTKDFDEMHFQKAMDYCLSLSKYRKMDFWKFFDAEKLGFTQ